MSEIQVEVCFTDKLESVRVGGKKMEIPKAVKAKPVEEWFEPAAGRVKWGGLGAEIKEMDFGGEKDAAYSFLFNGPEDKKQEFMECVERFCLGEEAQQETKKKTVQNYLQEAKKNQQAGNAEMAFQQYMIAARDYGHPEAQFEVARCYQNGMGVEKNEENAVVWYKKAAEQGNAEAQCALGECYQQAGNAEMAFQQYMVAARDYGRPEAQFEVARCYQNGTGVEKNEENAVVWYKKAAEQCDAEAQCALGECYYQARGVEKDDKEARRWYEAAATQGNVTAQYMTGRLYAALSYNVAAVKWYTKAAEQECPEAQYELGVCYEAGDGVGKDEAKAAELYRKAAVQGYAEAKKKGITLEKASGMDLKSFKEEQYDKLADGIRSHLDMERIYEIMKENVEEK